jgi:pseudouridine-5'-phosphate glycosidase
MTALAIAPTVQRAIEHGRPVVALESAVMTHGLPRPFVIPAVKRQVAACERAGGVPTIVAVFDHALRIGLTPDQCQALTDFDHPAKVSPWNLAAAISTPGFGGTTVAATVLAAELAGIKVVSTGGIGGVHPGYSQDVSADLDALARRRVCVVCAGPKSTLDAAATVERLETLGVPVIGWRSSLLAGFLAVSAGIRVPARADTIDALAAIVANHWELGGAGIVVSQPIPGELAIPPADLVGDGERSVRGPERTPTELSRLQARLGARVIDANLAVLEANAGLAGALAVALSRPVAAVSRG